LGCSVAWAEIVTRAIEYKQGDARLVGYLAYPKDSKTPPPGVLVVPETPPPTAAPGSPCSSSSTSCSKTNAVRPFLHNHTLNQ
jgi:hypothetical protein